MEEMGARSTTRGIPAGRRPLRPLACLAACAGLAAWRGSSPLLRAHLARLAGRPAGAGARAPGGPSSSLAPANGTTELRFLDELTHFLSHIPKTGAEYAAVELQRLLRATFRLPGNRTLRQVSAAQRRFNDTAFVGDFFANHLHFEYARFPARLAGDAGSDAYGPPSVCNFANTALARLQPYTVSREPIRYRCAMKKCV